MSRWLVLRSKDDQFSAGDMAELKDLAQQGRLRGGDLLQPPGADEWMYVEEVPDLKVLCADDVLDDDDDFSAGKKRSGGMLKAFFMLIILGCTATIVTQLDALPQGGEQLIGEGGLEYTEMLVTESSSSLRTKPDGSAAVAVALERNQVLNLMAKRGSFYRAQTKSGVDGWIPHDHVVPVYQFGDASVAEEYDPLYNPDRYFEVANGGWQQLATSDEGVTVFQFFLKNMSNYDMSNLVLLATIKDSRGQEIERVEIPVEGVIPAMGQTMVGTVESTEKKPKRTSKDDDVEAAPVFMTQHSFALMMEDDPEAAFDYRDGAEVLLESKDFTRASIDPLELRAVPTEDALKSMRKR
jgi:hypothetical protein